jgi:hypothetical protein
MRLADHGTELEHGKQLAVVARSLLPEQNW